MSTAQTQQGANNSATPPALAQYIPAHLLDAAQSGYYASPRTLVDLEVHGVNLSVEKSITQPCASPTLRMVAGEFGEHLSAAQAREVAHALLQLASLQEQLTSQQEGGAA